MRHELAFHLAGNLLGLTLVWLGMMLALDPNYVDAFLFSIVPLVLGGTFVLVYEAQALLRLVNERGVLRRGST